jgi:uridine kinase
MFESLARDLSTLSPSAGSSIIVGVDGCGGAGKSTFAARLSQVWEGSEVVHTDDFASWDCPIDWWPRLVEQVLTPLSEGRVALSQKYDWVKRELGEWVELASTRVVLEGVSAIRREFRPFLAYRIWVDCPAELRLARGLERDGVEMEGQWREWMAAEDAYVLRDDPVSHAHLIVNGTIKDLSIAPI